MKRVQVPIEVIMEMLETLAEQAGVTEVIIDEYEGYPCFIDAENPEIYYIVKNADEEGNGELH